MTAIQMLIFGVVCALLIAGLVWLGGGRDGGDDER